VDLPEAPQRVSVVGSTGTGKTTFARELAAILDVPFTELDAIVWQPGWKMLAANEFLARASERVAEARWVIDGNYGGAGVRQLVWSRADTIIWLDYSLLLIWRRLWRRTITRIRDRRELWPGTGNRETFRGAFLSRDSLFVWALTTHRRRRRAYAALFASPELAHARKLRFRDPAEADRWLEAQRTAASSRIHG
jgi:adenylate kinase family enzyme